MNIMFGHRTHRPLLVGVIQGTRRLCSLAVLALHVGCAQDAELFEAPEPGKGGDCPGHCVPIGPSSWTRDPLLLWIGNEIEAPECPATAPQLGYAGYAGLIAPDGCGECSCGPPSCELPAGITAHSTSCSGNAPGTIHTPFDAPLDWDGSCVAPPAVAASLLGSMTFAPLTVSPCVPGTGSIPRTRQASWKTYARACIGNAFDLCEDFAQVCSPTATPPPSGFAQCIGYLGEGDADCPATYPLKHVFYSGFSDTRNCTPCMCSAPVGSDCTAFFTAYADANCTTLIWGAWIGLDFGGCGDNGKPGNELQSMDATWVDNRPGSCRPSGGVPYGETTPINPSTFCCQEGD